jgi:hypothetical protein
MFIITITLIIIAILLATPFVFNVRADKAIRKVEAQYMQEQITSLKADMLQTEMALYIATLPF